MEDGKTSFWVELFHVSKEFGYSSAVGIVFIRALLQLFFIVVSLCVCLYVILATEAEWADDGEWHFLHAELGRHGRELALEGKVHQSGMDDVVLMVAEGDFCKTQFLGELEELLASLPRTEEARGLGVLRQIRNRRDCEGERSGDDVERDAETVAECLEIGGVCLVTDVLHADMEGFYRIAGL